MGPQPLYYKQRLREGQGRQKAQAGPRPDRRGPRLDNPRSGDRATGAQSNRAAVSPAKKSLNPHRASQVPGADGPRAVRGDDKTKGENMSNVDIPWNNFSEEYPEAAANTSKINKIV